MSLKNMFTNSFETQERGKDDSLTTHYYDDDYENTKAACIAACKKMGFQVKDINDDYGEILLTYPKGDLTITLFRKSYYVTGVDLFIITNYVISFGRGAKVIKDIYELLNHSLRLKKVGEA